MKATIRRGHRTARPVRARSRAAAAAFALLGLVQLFVCAVVPFIDARAPSRLGAHVEQQTERQHYVHDEAYCSACIARHLTGTAALPAPVELLAGQFTAQPSAPPLLTADSERRDPGDARAPPLRFRLG